jgi:hypothetical protein
MGRTSTRACLSGLLRRLLHALFDASTQFIVETNDYDLRQYLGDNSKFNHSYVRVPLNSHPDFYAFWADGDGKERSDSSLYYCNKAGDVFRLPRTIEGATAMPEPAWTGGKVVKDRER